MSTEQQQEGAALGEWWAEHRNIASLAGFMANSLCVSAKDLAYMVEKPWKFTEEYVEMLDVLGPSA